MRFVSVRGLRLLGRGLRQRWSRFDLLAGSIARRLEIYGPEAERNP